MSKRNLERALRKELEMLNDRIDEKILRGQSYAREAQRHKFVLSSLSRLRAAESRVGWLSNLLVNSF